MDHEPTDPSSPGALDNFLSGIEEKMEADFGVISSVPEKREAKQKIARELGLQDEYERGPVECYEACLKVDGRYEELLEAGEIREDSDWDDPRKELNQQLNAHLEEEVDLVGDVDNEI